MSVINSSSRSPSPPSLSAPSPSVSRSRSSISIWASSSIWASISTPLNSSSKANSNAAGFPPKALVSSTTASSGELAEGVTGNNASGSALVSLVPASASEVIAAKLATASTASGIASPPSSTASSQTSPPSDGITPSSAMGVAPKSTGSSTPGTSAIPSGSAVSRFDRSSLKYWAASSSPSCQSGTSVCPSAPKSSDTWEPSSSLSVTSTSGIWKVSSRRCFSMSKFTY